MIVCIYILPELIKPYGLIPALCTLIFVVYVLSAALWYSRDKQFFQRNIVVDNNQINLFKKEADAYRLDSAKKCGRIRSWLLYCICELVSTFVALLLFFLLLVRSWKGAFTMAFVSSLVSLLSLPFLYVFISAGKTGYGPSYLWALVAFL